MEDNKLSKRLSQEIVQTVSVDLTRALAQLAELTTSTSLEPSKFVEVHDLVVTLDKVFDDIKEVSRNRVLEFMRVHGQVRTAKGMLAYRFTRDGVEYEKKAHTRTGLDAQKIQALLMAKGISVSDGMDSILTWKPSLTKLHDLVEEGRLTPDEIDACSKPVSYSIGASHEVKQEKELEE